MSAFSSVRFQTDLAHLALFDPAVLRHRVRSPGSWWQEGDVLEVPEVADGRAIIAPIGRDGDYGARLTLEGPLESERPYLRESVGGLGVEVTSGALFVGPAERLPGDGGGDRLAALPGRGRCLEVAEGRYTAVITALDWRYDDRWFDDEGEVVAEAPPDFLIHLRPLPAGSPFERGEEVPSLLSLRARPEVKVAPASAPTLLARRSAPAESSRGRRASPARAPAPSASPRVRGLAAALTAEPALRPRWREMAGPALSEAALKPAGDALGAAWTPGELAKKVTRVREQLRMLEQKVNGGGLSVFDKAELQAAITGCYEALVELSAMLGGA